MNDTVKKPHTSKDVQVKYRKKTYKSICLSLRLKEDNDVINFFEREKKLGFTPTDVVKKLVRGEYN